MTIIPAAEFAHELKADVHTSIIVIHFHGYMTDLTDVQKRYPMHFKFSRPVSAPWKDREYSRMQSGINCYIVENVMFDRR